MRPGRLRVVAIGCCWRWPPVSPHRIGVLLAGPLLWPSGAVLAAVAHAERSRTLTVLVVLYAATALLAGGSLALTPDETLSWWPALTAGPDILTPVGVLLLPAALLVIAGLAVRALYHQATHTP